MDLEELLLGIKKSFLVFYGGEHSNKIEEVFKNLIVIETLSSEKGLIVKNINCDIYNTIYSKEQIRKLLEDLNSHNDNYTAGFMYPKAPIPTLVYKTQNGILPIGVIIHEISHILMVEKIAEVVDEYGKVINGVVIESMMGHSDYGNYTNEILNDEITKDVLAIFNTLCNCNFKCNSGYLTADSILGNPGRKIYKQLLPYIKKYMPYNALVIRKIMGNSNFKKLSDILEWQISHIQQSKIKSKEQYLEKYDIEVNAKKVEARNVVTDIEKNIIKYQQYEQEISKYVERLVEEGKARKTK